MTRKILVLACALVLLSSALAWGQQRRQSSSGWDFRMPPHKAEIIGYGGYTWTVSQDVYYANRSGKIDFKSGGSWGLQMNVNVRPGGQLTLLYNRQDTNVTFKSGGITDPYQPSLGIEYWQIGGTGGIMRGNVMPFSMFTIGGTRYVLDDPSVDDVWKFSMILGLGAKIYLNERFGLQVHGRMPYTFLSSGLYLGIGGGGASLGIGGTGIFQFDVGAGVMLTF